MPPAKKKSAPARPPKTYVWFAIILSQCGSNVNVLPAWQVKDRAWEELEDYCLSNWRTKMLEPVPAEGDDSIVETYFENIIHDESYEFVKVELKGVSLE